MRTSGTILRWTVMIALMLSHMGVAWAIDASVFPDDIELDLSFGGESLVVFGKANPAEDDVVILVEGERTDVLVYRTERVAVFWTQAKPKMFLGIPSYWTLAATEGFGSKVTSIDEEIRRQYRFDLNNIPLPSQEPLTPLVYLTYRQALIQQMAARGLFQPEPVEVNWVGSNLFRAVFHLPANVYSGYYSVRALLFQGNQLKELRDMRIHVRKSSFLQRSVELSRTKPFVYASFMVVLAVLLGLMMAWIARRLSR